MRFSQNPEARYYFLLDWPAALVGPRAFVLDYHLMQAYRDNGYYSKNIQDSHSFLCSHSDFVVLDAPNGNTLDAHNEQLTGLAKAQLVRYEYQDDAPIRMESHCRFRRTEVTRKLISCIGERPCCL